MLKNRVIRIISGHRGRRTLNNEEPHLYGGTIKEATTGEAWRTQMLI
jgi:hypothetical protein